MAMGIEYATDNGVDVINISQIFQSDYQVVKDAVNYATTSPNDVVIVCAAGNFGGPNSQDPRLLWPARYANTIAVGATTQNDERWTTNAKAGSMIGEIEGIILDVVAPGPDGSIWTTESGGGYTSGFGQTSGATPHVAGVAALVRSINSQLSWTQVRTILRNSADKVPAMNGANYTDELGYGRVDAYEALKYTLENYGGTLSSDLTIPAGETFNIQAGVTLRFKPNAGIIINGTLNVNGTSAAPVAFSRSGTSGTWDGIVFNSGSSGTLTYATVDHATKGVLVSGTDNVTVDNCTIQNFTEQGVYASNSSLTVQNSTIQNPAGASHGIYLLQGGNPTIKNNTIDGIAIGIERKDSPGLASV